MWSNELAKLEYFSPEVFVSQDPGEVRLCRFVLALALHANDSKSILGMDMHLIKNKPSLDGICEELGEYSGVKVYVDRLVYGHLHELHYLIQGHLKKIADLRLYKRVVKNLSQKQKKGWFQLVEMASAESNPEKQWLKDFRDGLVSHYVRHDGLYQGFLDWKDSLAPGKPAEVQEGAYISRGKSIKETRYYFSDAAVAAWSATERAKLREGERGMIMLLERNAIAVSGFVNQFIIQRGGRLKKSACPKFKKNDV